MKTTRRGFLGLLGLGVSSVVAGKAFAKVEKIGKKEGRYPLLYTTHEGARWQQWPSEMSVTDADLEKRADIYIIIGDRQVHSLRFWERKGEFVGWRRWDCVNGWNRVPDLGVSMSDDVDSSRQNHSLLLKMTEEKFKKIKRAE